MRELPLPTLPLALASEPARPRAGVVSWLRRAMRRLRRAPSQR